MNTRKLVAGTEIFVGTMLFALIAYGMYLRFFVGSEEFVRFVREDGPVEYLTAFSFFSAVLYACIGLLNTGNQGRNHWSLRGYCWQYYSFSRLVKK